MAGLQVLHVDDEPDMRLLVKLSLDLDDDIRTRSAASGLEALDTTQHWTPDVILLDAAMPGMDGLATLKALQNNPKTANIPVMFLTGKCADSDVDAFKAGGCAGVIAKPFDPRGLVTTIRDYFRENPHTPPAGASLSETDFVGAGQGVGASAWNAGTALSGTGATLANATTTQALLLDGNGNAFALSFADHSNGWPVSPIVPQNGSGFGGATISAPDEPGSPGFTLHVQPLDDSVVSGLLGLDEPLSVSPALEKSINHDLNERAIFASDHAIGCGPLGGATIFADPMMSGSTPTLAIGTGSTVPDWMAGSWPHKLLH